MRQERELTEQEKANRGAMELGKNPAITRGDVPVSSDDEAMPLVVSHAELQKKGDSLWHGSLSPTASASKPPAERLPEESEAMRKDVEKRFMQHG